KVAPRVVARGLLGNAHVHRHGQRMREVVIGRSAKGVDRQVDPFVRDRNAVAVADEGFHALSAGAGSPFLTKRGNSTLNSPGGTSFSRALPWSSSVPLRWLPSGSVST